MLGSSAADFSSAEVFIANEPEEVDQGGMTDYSQCSPPKEEMMTIGHLSPGSKHQHSIGLSN